MKPLVFAFLLFLSVNLSAQKVKPVTLDQLHQRIKLGNDTTYIINFWATWCVPCLEELPHFEKLSRDFQTSRLKVLLVSVDFRSKMENTVLPFVRKKGLKNEVLLLDEPDQQTYINRIDTSWSGALPATLIISKDRRSFFEKEFTYNELLKEYKNIQKP